MTTRTRESPEIPVLRSRSGAWRRRFDPAPAALLGLLLATASGAQVVTTEDDAIAPLPGSLRSEIEAAPPGGVVRIEIPEADDATTIDLVDGIGFSSPLTLDNSDEAFGIVPIFGPEQGSFVEVADDVTLTLRDITLLSDPVNPDGMIDLQGASTRLVLVSTRQTQTIDADIVGAGALLKQGPAALDLLGVNSFTGGITIEQGDVIGDVLSLATEGMGDILLAPSTPQATARIVFDIGGAGDALSMNGPAFLADESSGGRAVFVKRGAGELDVRSATFDQTIAFDVESGTLVVDDALVNPATDGAGNIVAASRDFNVQSSGILAIEGLTPRLTGALTGSGAVEFTPALALGGVLAIDGDLLAFDGDLRVQQQPNGSGLVAVTFDPATPPSGPLSFSVELDRGTFFEVIDDSSFTFSGDISGAGQLTKGGSGSTRLTGNASHTGGTLVAAGALIGNLQNLQGSITVASGAELRFDQQTDGTFLGSILERSASEEVLVRKVGPGVLTLGVSQGFAGRLEIDDGGLAFAPGVGLTSGAADLIVGNADSVRATLSTPFLTEGSQVANTVSIGGDLSLNGDARLLVTLSDRDESGSTAATRSTRFAAGGTVTVGSGASSEAPDLVVRLQPGSFADPAQRRFTILTGSMVQVEQDFQIQNDLFFFDLQPAGATSDAGTYQIDLLDSGATLAGAAQTPNQRTVGGALDDLRASGPGADDELSRVFDNLNTITGDEVEPILEGLAADSLTAATNLRLAAAARTWRSLSNRLALARAQSIGNHEVLARRRDAARRAARLRRSRPAGSSPTGSSSRPPSVDAAAPVDEPAFADEARQPWVAWMEASGVLGEIDSDASNGYDYRIVGPILGADRALGENVRIGFATSATHSSYDADSASSEGSMTSVEGTLYGAWIGKPVEILIAGRFGHSWIESERQIQIGEIDNRVDGDLEGDELGIYAELTRAFGSVSQVEVAPFARVAYSRVETDGFDEDGNDPLRLRVDGDDVDSTITSLGVRIGIEREMDQGFVLRPRLEASWGREWADVERPLRGRFAAGSTPIVLEGAELPRDRAEIAVGWEVGYARHANLYLGWNGRFGEGLIENALSLGVRAAW